jgi:hypothetical protein
MATEQDIERLYQLPMSEFTTERNALLKRTPAGAEKAAVRALQKPTAPAWAVNQLFWHRRKTFDRLLHAADRLRAAHAQQLAGKRADVAAAERDHQDALRAATDETRELLRAAGDAASPATMTAVNETLQAVPGRNDHGRLVKPLKPLGFEALSGLIAPGATIAPFAPRGTTSQREPAKAPEPKQTARTEKAEREAERRASEARRKELAAVERALRDAQSAEREAQAALSRAEMTLVRTQRERKALQEQLDALIARADELTAQLGSLRREAERKAAERVRLEDRRDALG